MQTELKISDKASADFVRLVSYVNEMENGFLLEYKVTQKQTGIKMDSKGRTLLRRAILRCHREYALCPGVGFKLAQPDLAMPIMTKRFLSIDSRIKRAEKAHKALLEFRASLNPDERRGFDFAGALFGAIRVAAENGKKLYGRNQHQLAESNPIVPDNI